MILKSLYFLLELALISQFKENIISRYLAYIWGPHFCGNCKHKLRKRFVDDTFVIMQTNEVNRFFNHLNNVDANINFTIKLEQDDKLSFLDVPVMLMQNEKLATKVYRKTTHINRYLNYHSAHSNEQKQGVATNLYHPAELLITKSTD